MHYHPSSSPSPSSSSTPHAHQDVPPSQQPCSAPLPPGGRSCHLRRGGPHAGQGGVLAALGALAFVVGALLVAGVTLWLQGYALRPATASGMPAGTMGPGMHGLPADALRLPIQRALDGGTCTAGSRNAFGESITIGSNEHICGDASVYGGQMTVAGVVDGTVTAVGGDVTVSGEVGGDVRAVGGDVYLESGAQVLGNVHAVGGNVVRAPGALVGGNVQRADVTHDIAPLGWVGLSDHYSFPWLSVLFWALAAVCAAHFFPEPLGRVRAIARTDFSRSLATGAVALIAGALISLVLIATCLGLPVALLVIGAMWLAWVVGTVAIGLLVGDRLLRAVGPSGLSPVPSAVLGVTVLALAESIPCAGGVLSLVVACAGVGATTLAALHARRPAYRRPWPA